MYHYATRHDIYFYETGSGIRRAAKRGKLIKLGGDPNYALHAVSYPYVRPMTKTFVERLAAEYRKECKEIMVVTSAIRPARHQPSNSVKRSVHPTGIAVDLRKPQGHCLTWLRKTLLSLEKTGVLEVTEEFAPPHFHVAVYGVPYRSYVRRITGQTSQLASNRSTTDQLGSKGHVYPVQNGDTLWDIARAYHTNVDRLMEANNLRSSVIQPGQKLIIPSAN
jgi:LysM repeat protein